MKLLKTLTRTVVLECYANRYARKALREIERAYREMLREMVEYAVEHKASQNTLHKVFYSKFRERYPWLPTRVIKGAYRDAVRRAKSFRELKKRGRAYTDKPEIRRVTITYSDSQDWRLGDGVIKLRTHSGWVELHYRNHKQLHKYLYGGWKLCSELRFKLIGRKVVVYLTFTKHFEVEYEPRNVVAVDVNENNVTVAVFKNSALTEVYRVETGLGRIVIAYAERRRRIAEGESTKTREVRKKLRKLREKERKLDVLRKTAKFIEKLVAENRAVAVVGNIGEEDKVRMESDKSAKLRHRIHQWSAATIVKLLEEKPVHVVRVSEKGSSSIDPFTGLRVGGYSPLVTRFAAKGASGVKVMKLVLRVARVNGRVLERDAVGAVNIGLKYLNPDGSPVALGSTGTHEVWVKLVSPHRGAAPTVSGETLNLVVVDETGRIVYLKTFWYTEVTSHGFPRERARELRLRALYTAIDTAILVGASTIAFENLFLVKKKRFTRSPRANRRISRFAKKQLLVHGLLRAIRRGLRIVLVDPKGTTSSAEHDEVMRKHGLDRHTASAYLIALKGLATESHKLP